MNLPAACELCAPFSGAWMESETGLKRCQCERGKALIEAAKPKPPRPPTLSPDACTVFAEMMGAMPDFYPRTSGERAPVADEISRMCETTEDALWLVRRMLRLYRKWPGIEEMRLVYCAGRKPLDGLQAICASAAYPDGIPSEHDGAPQAALPAPERKRLSAGECTAAASVADTLQDLARATNLKRALGPPPIIRPIPVARVSSGTITPEMIAAAVAQSRAQKLAEEMAVQA